MSQTKNLSRSDAKRRLAELRVSLMGRDERGALLDEWWTIDEEDSEWTSLPVRLQQEMSRHEEPVANPNDDHYLPLLVVAVLHGLEGVRNEWLAAKLAGIEGGEFVVAGSVEPLDMCPCCSFQTLRERGEYYVCPVCFWEDDGSDEIQRYSMPNHKSLADGRSSFVQTGVSDLRFVGVVADDVQDKYVAGVRLRDQPSVSG